MPTMTLQVFTTGHGTPYGLAAAPVIKVATRTELAHAVQSRASDLIAVRLRISAAGVPTARPAKSTRPYAVWLIRLSSIRIRYIMEYIYIKLDQIFSGKLSNPT